MKLKMGTGNVTVAAYGDPEPGVIYGVAFCKHKNSGEIGAADPERTSGMRVDKVKPDLQIEFSRAASVQVLIDQLSEVRDSLRKAGYD